ncbi:hypothetical protein BKA81DRAFT_129121 [Phyllosticta paracitricarpa]|uniref:Uncharacterized protein n=1 Tax=Phyllosticta paracitricarpa TaxID=2016321 RepID=A0ABR1N4T3_9PEZI
MSDLGLGGRWPGIEAQRFSVERPFADLVVLLPRSSSLDLDLDVDLDVDLVATCPTTPNDARLKPLPLSAAWSPMVDRQALFQKDFFSRSLRWIHARHRSHPSRLALGHFVCGCCRASRRARRGGDVMSLAQESPPDVARTRRLSPRNGTNIHLVFTSNNSHPPLHFSCNNPPRRHLAWPILTASRARDPPPDASQPRVPALSGAGVSPPRPDCLHSTVPAPSLRRALPVPFLVATIDQTTSRLDNSASFGPRLSHSRHLDACPSLPRAATRRCVRKLMHGHNAIVNQSQTSTRTATSCFCVAPPHPRRRRAAWPVWAQAAAMGGPRGLGVPPARASLSIVEFPIRPRSLQQQNARIWPWQLPCNVGVSHRGVCKSHNRKSAGPRPLGRNSASAAGWLACAVRRLNTKSCCGGHVR